MVSLHPPPFPMCLCVSSLIPEHFQLVSFEHTFILLTVAISPSSKTMPGLERPWDRPRSSVRKERSEHLPQAIACALLLASDLHPKQVCWLQGTNTDREMGSVSPLSQSHLQQTCPGLTSVSGRYSRSLQISQK